MDRTACTEPQCLYKGALYLYLWSWKSTAIPLLPLWTLRPVQSLSACTRVHFTFTFSHERVGLYLYSPYGPYGLYRASVPLQGCTLPLPLPLLLYTLNLNLNLTFYPNYICYWINSAHGENVAMVTFSDNSLPDTLLAHSYRQYGKYIWSLKVEMYFLCYFVDVGKSVHHHTIQIN